MRARTIGQIVTLIAGHMGGTTAGGSPPQPAVTATPAPAEEVDVEALSNEEIDRLLDGRTGLGADPEINEVPSDART